MGLTWEGGRERENPGLGTPLHPLSAQALAAHGEHILPGDEIVQVNEQVVVSRGQGLQGAAGFGREDTDWELQGWEGTGSTGAQLGGAGVLAAKSRSRGWERSGGYRRHCQEDLGDVGSVAGVGLGDEASVRPGQWPTAHPGLAGGLDSCQPGEEAAGEGE